MEQKWAPVGLLNKTKSKSTSKLGAYFFGPLCIHLKLKQESCAIAKMTAQWALYMGTLKIFGTLWLRPRPLFAKYGFLFRWYRPNERWWVPTGSPYIVLLYQHSVAQNFTLQFSVGVVNPQFWGRGGRRGSGMAPFERALVSSYKTSIHIIRLSALICWNFRLQFWVGVANPKFWGKWGHRGSGIVSLLSFYRPSIVTFPLSLRVSEILPLLFSNMQLLPQIPLCFPNSRWIAFWLQRAKVLG